MDYNLDNYLEEVVSPALNPTQYAQGMTDMVETINANFRKIIGLPFIQGDAGESVVITREYIYEAGTNYDAFTDFGKELVKAIYKDYIPDEDLRFVAYSELQEYLSINNEITFAALETYSCSFLAPKTTEDYETGNLIRDDDANYITMQSVGDKKVSDSIYFFIDERTTEENLATIMGNETMRQRFEDCSCGIYCLYENGQWTLTRNYMLPRFYWDEDLSMFCWKLNNLKTHVTAQGIPGEAGQSAKMYICKGTASLDVNTTPFRIVLSEVWDPTSDPDNPHWAWVSIPENKSLENSIVGVWFKQADSETYNGFVIGVVDKEDDDWVMYYQDGEGGINMDFQSIINHFTLKTLLDQVGLRDASSTLNEENENTPARARGLYIRASLSNSEPQDNEDAHIFAMRDAILGLDPQDVNRNHPVLTPADYKYTNTESTDERMDRLPDPGNLTVNYNTNVTGDLFVKKDVMVAGDTTIGTETDNADLIVHGNAMIGSDLDPETEEPDNAYLTVNGSIMINNVSTDLPLLNMYTSTREIYGQTGSQDADSVLDRPYEFRLGVVYSLNEVSGTDSNPPITRTMTLHFCYIGCGPWILEKRDNPGPITQWPGRGTSDNPYTYTWWDPKMFNVSTYRMKFNFTSHESKHITYLGKDYTITPRGQYLDIHGYNVNASIPIQGSPNEKY